MLQFFANYFIIFMIVSAGILIIPPVQKGFALILTVVLMYKPLQIIVNVVEFLLGLGIFVSFFSINWWVPFLAIFVFSITRFIVGYKLTKLIMSNLDIDVE